MSDADERRASSVILKDLALFNKASSLFLDKIDAAVWTAIDDFVGNWLKDNGWEGESDDLRGIWVACRASSICRSISAWLRVVASYTHTPPPQFSAETRAISPIAQIRPRIRPGCSMSSLKSGVSVGIRGRHHEGHPGGGRRGLTSSLRM
jgi:hypothetical protein